MTENDAAQLSATYRRYLASVVLFHLAAADEVGLTGSDYQANSILDLDGPVTSGELARRLGLSTGATTRLIDRLIAGGFARRVADPADRRRVLVTHTGKTPERLDAILADVRDPIGEIIGGMTKSELGALARYFTGAAEAYRAGLDGLGR
ncbi:MarR family transcriptional regulator [Microbacterium sp. LTA6]|uniref:MarR family winged helix-turn-helix transcriptional regulator n=1 Tax=Microbacterium sp. LTA6 TaxID=3129771 RepID=UPI00324EF488